MYDEPNINELHVHKAKARALLIAHLHKVQMNF